VPAMCFAQRFARVTCICGKSMLFRRREMEDLGGIERFGGVLAEDFLLGVAYKQADLRLMLSRATTVDNINVQCTSKEFANRHLRWLIMERLVHRSGFACNLLGNPILFALLAWFAASFHLSVGFIAMGTVIIKIAGDRLLAHRLRGVRFSLAYSMLIPFKDLFVAGLWVRAIWLRKVNWRGTTIRLGPGSEILRSDDVPARAPAFAPVRA
jgi:ceramide glucosyltransferase